MNICGIIGVQSIQFSYSVISDSLQPHGLQHARPPCPLLSPRVCPSSCPPYDAIHPYAHLNQIPKSQVQT